MKLSLLTTRARCMRAARVLQSYLDGEVDAPTARAVERHLEECRRCGLEAATYTAIKAAITMADDGRTPDVDPAAVARLRQFARALADGGDPGG